MLVELKRRHAADGGELELDGAAARVWFERVGRKGPWPATEAYLTVAPAGVADKEESYFAELWDYVRGLRMPRQMDLLAG